MAAYPEWFPDKVRTSLGLPPPSSFPVGVGKTSKRDRHSCISGSSSMGNLLFRLGGGWLLHNVITFIFQILTEDQAASLTTCSTMICLRASLIFLLLSIFLFPRNSCSFRPWFLMPLLQFCCSRYLFSNFDPLGVARTKSSLVRLFCGFRYTTAGCWSPDQSSSALIVSTMAS
jgi:hypothetical protein